MGLSQGQLAGTGAQRGGKYGEIPNPPIIGGNTKNQFEGKLLFIKHGRGQCTLTILYVQRRNFERKLSERYLLINIIKKKLKIKWSKLKYTF